MHDDNLDLKSFRFIVEGIAELGTVSVNGVPYTGSALAFTVAIRDTIEEEAQRTVQLIAELGRLSAAAHRIHREREVEYRIWRDSLIFKMTEDLDEAKKAGFDCAINPGFTAKGEEKPAKTPSLAKVEQWMRTLDEYREQQKQNLETQEAWETIHSSYEAAKQRAWCIKVMHQYQLAHE